MSAIEEVIGMLAAVAGLGLLARKVPIPYPILLVLGGLVLAVIPGLPQVALDPELVFFVFLPPLLYPAALFTPWRDFSANIRPILLLAVGLLLFTTIAVGTLVHYFIPEFPITAGFVLGAIISPTDTVAAMAIAEHMRVPHRIVTILEGESLVNDATALVALRFAVAAVVSGTFSLGQAAAQFLLVGVGGIVLGLVVGYVTALILTRIDDAPIEITISLLTPFISYLPAEQLGLSGVLAVVSTGLYHGWRIPEMTTTRSRLQGGPVWQMVEFLLNGFIFLLIGLQLPEVLRHLSGRPLTQLLSYALIISLAVIIVRIIWVFPATYLPRVLFERIRRRDPYPSWRHVSIVAWTGMRGVVSLAAALALPLGLKDGSAFPGRDLILFLTFVVIIATLVLQGLTLPSMIRWLGVEDDRAVQREERAARLKANQAALARLNELNGARQINPETLNRLRIEYEDRIQQLLSADVENVDGKPGLFSSEYEQLSLEALKEERKTILQLRNDLVINDEVLRLIQRDIDFAEVRVRRPQG